MASLGLKSLPLLMIASVHQVVSTRVGQNFVRFLDRLLGIAEALNFFSAPQSEQEEACRQIKGLEKYQRPLPWIIFLPALIYCRTIRKVVFFLAASINKDFSAIMMVYHINSWRRQLNCVKLEALRAKSEVRDHLPPIPVLLRYALNIFTHGPLRMFLAVVNLVWGDKNYNKYSVMTAQRSRRSLKKLKAKSTSECTTDELLDKLADEDENDPEDDPDFEVKSSDLASETEDEEDEGDVEDVGDEENSGPEEDEVVRENGRAPEQEEHANNQDPGNNQHDNNGQHQDNHHEQQHHQHQEQQQHHEHHHY